MRFLGSPGSRRAVLLVLLIVVATSVAYVTRSSEESGISVPRSIPRDCSRDVSGDINAFLASVPDGSTVHFPTKGCYAQSAQIELRKRHNLTIDGHGSTFRSSAPNDDSKQVCNWFLLLNRNVAFRNATIIGNFDDPGPPTPNRGSATSNAGICIYGNIKVSVSDVDIKHVFGDGVTIAVSWYVDPEASRETPRDIRLSRINVDKAARHCVSPSQVLGFRLEDSILNDCYLDGIDAEKDLITDELGDLHFVGNTITNYFGLGLVVPIGGLKDSPVDGIEIRGNRFPTLAHAAACNQPIGVAGYEHQYFSNVVIEDNDLLAWRNGVVVQRALSGSISNNRFSHPPEARVNDCGTERDADVVVIESPEVTVENSGSTSVIAVPRS
jgi:hypothetical protein